MSAMGSLSPLLDEESFRKMNYETWHENSEFWLSEKMGHINAVKERTISIIKDLIDPSKKRQTLVDQGCGDGWIYEAIRASSLPVSYIGLDFNEIFIQYLKNRFASDDEATFIECNLEQKVPSKIKRKADIVVNCFNFFELPSLTKAFNNTENLLNSDGALVIVTIDPISQIRAVSKNQSEYIDNLHHYASSEKRLSYKKTIVVNGRKSDRVYHGILYSVEDYFTLAKSRGFSLADYSEVLDPNLPFPQLYQFLTFVKK